MSYKTNLPVLCCVLILLVSFLSVGQLQADDSDKNSLRAGATALQFELSDRSSFRSPSDVVDVDPFLGSTISLKKHISDKVAYRIGVTVGFDNTDVDRYQESTHRTGGDRRYETETSMIELTIQRVLYMSIHDKVSGFWGFGPVIEKGSTERRSDYPFSSGRYAKSIDDSDYWLAGITGVVGVEWFLRKKISLLAEYNTRLVYSKRESTSEKTSFQNGIIDNYDKYRSSSKSFRLESMDVKVGLSMYL